MQITLIKCDDAHARLRLLEVCQAAATACGWLTVKGGLISNLRVWENMLLPMAWQRTVDIGAVEARVIIWAEKFGVEQSGLEDVLAALPGRISSRERCLVELWRTLLQVPALVLVDSRWFEWLTPPDALPMLELVEAEIPDSHWYIAGPVDAPPAWRSKAGENLHVAE